MTIDSAHDLDSLIVVIAFVHLRIARRQSFHVFLSANERVLDVLNAFISPIIYLYKIPIEIS